MPDTFDVVFAIYPRVTQLDFTGPHEVFWRMPGARCILASSEGGEIEADGGIVFTRVRRIADVERCDLLCVPGGFGTIEAIEDAALLAHVRRLAATARYVTSVCTGSLVLVPPGCLQASAPRRTGHGGTRSRRSARSRIRRAWSATATSSPAAA